MVKEVEAATAVHEFMHMLGGRSERITEQTAQRLYHDMSPSQRRKLRRFIPPDTKAA